MHVKDAVGRWGEQVAVGELERAGMAILARNWRCRAGEIDIVARDGSTVVIVEVKTRSTVAFGEPSEAVGRVKRSRLRRLAVHWLADNPGGDAVRFDVVSVVRGGRGPCRVDHLRDAF